MLVEWLICVSVDFVYSYLILYVMIRSVAKRQQVQIDTGRRKQSRLPERRISLKIMRWTKAKRKSKIMSVSYQNPIELK
jgi:hypothetical protein